MPKGNAIPLSPQAESLLRRQVILGAAQIQTQIATGFLTCEEYRELQMSTARMSHDLGLLACSVAAKPVPEEAKPNPAESPVQVVEISLHDITEALVLALCKHPQGFQGGHTR